MSERECVVTSFVSGPDEFCERDPRPRPVALSKSRWLLFFFNIFFHLILSTLLHLVFAPELRDPP